jgi:hypothetical protein
VIAGRGSIPTTAASSTPSRPRARTGLAAQIVTHPITPPTAIMSLESDAPHHDSLGEVLHGHMAPEESIKEERGKSLGVKSIGTFLSFIFVINQIYGPGVLAIPLVYAQSGLVLTFFMVTFFLLVSSLAATCLAQAIASIPDNRQYQQRVEFGTAVEYYYGHKWHVAFQICLNITVQAYNIASVVICAQSLDQAFIATTGKMYAFELGPDTGFHEYLDTDAVYKSSRICLSLGYALITLFFLPAGFLNLNDNVKTVQVGSFIFLVILMLEFIVFFIWRGGQEGFHAVPAFGNNYSQLVSVFIFSWAYVSGRKHEQAAFEFSCAARCTSMLTHSCWRVSLPSTCSQVIFVPSWLNEKAVETSVNKVIWSAGIASWVGYIAIGWLCAAVFTGSNIGLDDMLVSLSKNDMPTITRITSHLFSLGVIAPGIPVCCVTTRYNLYVGGIVGKKQSYFWGCIAPWIIGFIFCQGEIFANLIAWTSLVFNGFVNFTVPFIMYLTSLRRHHAGGAPSDPSTQASVEGGINATARYSEEDVYQEDNLDEEEHLKHMASSYNAPVPALSESTTPSTSSRSGKGDLKVPLLSDAAPSGGSSSSAYGGIVTSPSDSASPMIGGAGAYALGTRADGSHSMNVRFCAPVQDMQYQHGPVYPLPESMRPYAYQWVLGILIVTQVVIVAQTVGDIYYAAIGTDPLSA